MSNEVTQFVDGALRAAPPITVSAASVFGLGLEDWMYIATIVYTVLQGSYLAYHWRRSHGERCGVRGFRHYEPLHQLPDQLRSLNTL